MKKSFDPLASLFDGGNRRSTPAGQPLPEIDELPVDDENREVVEYTRPSITDPLVSDRASALDIVEPAGVPEWSDPGVRTAAIPEEAAEATAVVPRDVLPQPRMEDLDDTLIRPGLSEETLAAASPVAGHDSVDADPIDDDEQDERSFDDDLDSFDGHDSSVDEVIEVKAPRPPPRIGDNDKLAIARALAAQAMARAEQRQTQAPVDKAALARELAAQAIARQAAAKSAAPKPSAPKPAAAKPAAAKPVSNKPEDRSARLASLAGRAPRAGSAMEAVAQAREAEARRKADEQVDLSRHAGELVARQLSGVKGVEVVATQLVDDRVRAKVLWKAHRARFASEGAVQKVVATAHVIRALDAVASEQLAVVLARTPKGESLVWVDLGSQVPIAAFADGRGLVPGLS